RPRTFFKWLAISLAAILIVPPATAGVALATYLFMPLPASLPNEKPQADSRVSTVYAVDGTAIGEFREAESRVVIPPDQIPHNMKIAVIASEDQNFYQHSGVDWQGIARAFWADVRNRSLKQGGSTITQQLAKNLYTDGERTITRKAKEALIAAQVERVMTKDEIIAKYLNTVYMGDSVFGVEAAAQSYFKKEAKQLTLSEAALLAGVLPAPSLYSPRSNPENAERRRKEVLNQIEELGLAPPEEVAKARADKYRTQSVEERPGPKIHPPPGVVGRYPYFLDYLRIYLLEVKKYSPDLVFRGGLKIETSLDPHLQEHAEKLLKKTFPAPKDPEAALVGIEPQTGYVRTLVGGTNWEESKVNLALGRLGGGSGRQAGSAFKPFVLARAFEAGVSPSKTYSAPSCITPRGFTKPVCNYEGGSFGSANLSRAMAASINTVFVQLIVDVGIKQTAEVAKRLGITSIDLDKPVYGGIAIGTQEVSPLDMSSSFGVFAARGLRAEPTPVLKITQRDGSLLEDNTIEDRTTRVLEEPVADNMNKILTGVVEGGTGTAAKIGRPAAGKTGTSEEYQNAWFVGYT
ncbi:MAG TPA: transglycosylase domain-containing protein, partial [Acidimicrobiia bacterium]|nr:transglycosylase domain-containing protein [Acidimicrobiia bacterium]